MSRSDRKAIIARTRPSLTGGRKKGSKNRRTLEVEEALRPLLPAAKRKLKTLMASDDDKVAYSAVMGIFAYIYGRPIDRKELSGPDGAPLIEPTRYEELHGRRSASWPTTGFSGKR